MESESWIETAERLRRTLELLPPQPILETEEARARETITIALWPPNEFATEERGGK